MERILIVEDDRALREVNSTYFELEGYEVRQAANGREAVDLLAGWQPDIILLDLMMPVMDGWGFRAAQMGDPAIADIPVVVFSGGMVSRQDVARLKPTALLQKPAMLRAVVRTVKEVLAERADGGRTHR